MVPAVRTVLGNVMLSGKYRCGNLNKDFSRKIIPISICVHEEMESTTHFFLLPSSFLPLNNLVYAGGWLLTSMQLQIKVLCLTNRICICLNEVKLTHILAIIITGLMMSSLNQINPQQLKVASMA